MVKTKETGSIDASTEEKIRNAARAVFQRKGYAAARTRDIAEESGINLSLLNYYFRSKEKLFEIVMSETFTAFFKTVTSVVNDENSAFEEKIELLVNNYIDMLIKEPHVPMFILSEIRNRPEYLLKKLNLKAVILTSVFVRQFHEKAAAGEIKEPNFLNFMMNLLSMIVFPVIGQPLLTLIGGLSETQFNQLIEQRKKLIPLWIKAMLTAE